MSPKRCVEMQECQNKNVADAVASLFIVVSFCACLFLIIHDAIVVTSQDILQFSVLWVASLVGGYFLESYHMAMLGSMLSGLLLNSVFKFHVHSQLGDFLRTFGLTTILLMSGLEIDVEKVRRAGFVCLKLSFIPGVMEAFASGTTALLLFNMPITLALSLGFILGAVSPVIVVPGMLQLKKLGYGVENGVPSLVMAAASFDDIVAITGFTICIGIALDSSDNIALSVFTHGPVQIFLGGVMGCLGGIILAMARCSKPGLRSVIAVELGVLITYLYRRLQFDGVGAISTLLMGTIAKLIWQQKRVTEYAIENHAFTVASCKEYLHEIGSDVNTLFKIAVRPLLFGSIGAAFDLNTLPTETLLKSCAVVVIGVMARLPAAYFSAKGNLSSKERLFVAASWIPKASVQAALSTLPLSMIKDKMGTRDNYEELVMWGSQIMSTAVIAIMITAPLGLLSIQILGPRLLSRESEQDAGPYCPKQKDNTQEIEQTCTDSA